MTSLLVAFLLGLRVACLVGMVRAWRQERYEDSALWAVAGLLCTLTTLELRQ